METVLLCVEDIERLKIQAMEGQGMFPLIKTEKDRCRPRRVFIPIDTAHDSRCGSIFLHARMSVSVESAPETSAIAK